jgi:hypothetical protein
MRLRLERGAADPDDRGPPYNADQWIFAYVHEAGAQEIFVEQDRCSLPVLEAIKISYEYLRKVQVSCIGPGRSAARRCTLAC